VSGGTIQRLNCVKYLGLMMDNGLRWSDLRVLYTDGSKSKTEDSDRGNNLVVCAIFIRHIEKSFSYKFNPLTSSFMAETFDNRKIFRNNEYLLLVTGKYICSDSLSVLQSLKNSE